MVNVSNQKLTNGRTALVMVAVLTLMSTTALADARDDDDGTSANGRGSVPTFNSQPNLTFAVDKFWAVGTVAINNLRQIVVGDHVGSDPSDSDGDGNVENVWNFGTPLGGADPDLLISKKAFLGDLRLNFQACIGVTHVSYQYISIGFSNPLFTGQPGTAIANPPTSGNEIGFMTRWEDPSTIQIWRDSAVTTAVPLSVGLALTSEGFCATYEIKRLGERVYASVNGVQVFAGAAFGASGPTAIFVRSWDSPIKIWNLKWRAIEANRHDGDDD